MLGIHVCIYLYSERLARELWQATNDGDIDRVTALLEKGVDPNHHLFWTDRWKKKYPPLQRACRSNYPGVVKLLVERGGAAVNRGDGDDNSTALHWACVRGHKDIMQYLVKGAKCNVGECVGTV